MNARQRRYWKRMRPVAGLRVMVYDPYVKQHFVGVVSSNQYFSPPTHVRIDYDNGDYRTWRILRIDEVRS